jgi:hypothetical protein
MPGGRRVAVALIALGLALHAPESRAQAYAIELSAKSFIQHIDLERMAAENRPAAEISFVRFVNRHYSENPTYASPEVMDFRLWSRVELAVACSGDRIEAWRASPIKHRAGRQLGVLLSFTYLMTPLIAEPEYGESGALRKLRLSYAIKGRPNAWTRPSFRAVRPRFCEYIWHRVSATLACEAGRARLEAQIEGSRFPSHRVWSNGRMLSSAEQGPFSALWDCEPGGTDLVR